MDTKAMREQFKQQGFVLVRQLLNAVEVEHYIEILERQSGITRSDFKNNSGGRGFDKKGGQTSWNLPDGVSKTPDFWSLIWDERLVDIVRQLLGPGVRYMQHSDLQVGFSAISWHRDNVNRTLGYGPDWYETDQPYRLVRVGIYLQRYQESGFKLGFIPGSHRPPDHISIAQKLTEAKLRWMGGLSYVFASLQMRASNAEWIATEPGDAVIFDPRTLHSGSYISGPKYSLFVAYGLENDHFYNHQNYYRHIRAELNYQDLAPELVQKLTVVGLYPEHTPAYDQIQDAWVPVPVLRNLLAKQFK
jgi:ectoine hydroxylase-related dioxygenase (phytanoyl-CoA dioxygenase family)